jgi:hypothetical protein
MHPVTMAALLLACLTLPMSSAFAQIGPTEMATGDVWSSREELVYIPREALELPQAVSPADVELATGDVWATPQSGNRLAEESLAPKIVQDQTSEQANR